MILERYRVLRDGKAGGAIDDLGCEGVEISESCEKLCRLRVETGFWDRGVAWNDFLARAGATESTEQGQGDNRDREYNRVFHRRNLVCALLGRLLLPLRQALTGTTLAALKS